MYHTSALCQAFRKTHSQEEKGMVLPTLYIRLHFLKVLEHPLIPRHLPFQITWLTGIPASGLNPSYTKASGMYLLVPTVLPVTLCLTTQYSILAKSLFSASMGSQQIWYQRTDSERSLKRLGFCLPCGETLQVPAYIYHHLVFLLEINYPHNSRTPVFSETSSLFPFSCVITYLFIRAHISLVWRTEKCTDF